MSTQPLLQFDPSYAKHAGNRASVAAHDRIKYRKSSAHEAIFGLLLRMPMTAKEVACHQGVQLNTISGRFTEMAIEKRIRRTGERRDGACVWEVVR